MRYILLKGDDFAMFHQDIDPVGYEFYYRHKETFRRMYNEQGKEFWVRYMLSFRSAQSYDILRLFKGKIKHLSDFVDSFYINVHEEFIDGPFSRAKQLFDDIVKVAEDQGYLSILHSHSLAKNPFYRKDTKDIYRRFFGNPVDISSYLKVFILLPMYRRLAGSLCVCLRRWLDASELTNPTDKSYWVPPPPVPTDKVKECCCQNDCLKLHDLKMDRVDILKLTITKDNTSLQSGVGKENDHVCNGKREKADGHVCNGKREKASKDLDFAAEDIVLNSELVERLSSLFQLSNSYLGLNVMLPDLEGDARFQRKPEKGKQSCDEGPPTKTTPEAQAKLEALSAEKEMVQRLHDVNDCGYFDSFGIHVKRRSTDAGESKIELKISAAKKEPGMKQTGDIQNGGTAETKCQHSKELKAKASNKSDVHKEPCAKTKSRATNSKAGKETGAEKEVKATEESNSRRKAKATEKSDAKLESKATEESDSRKNAKVTKESNSGEKVKATKESDSRRKAKVTEDSSAKPEFKATEESSCEKEAKATVDDSEVVKGTDHEEEKELSRPGSKNVRMCTTCGLQEPAPKVFKKCKRCKDEGCSDPPYYCGRDCQVLDWTGRHRQEHEKSCA